MAGSILSSGGSTTEYKVSQRSADRARNHDPAVVCHEDEPGQVRMGRPARLWKYGHYNNEWTTREKKKSSHDHKGVEILDSIEKTLDDVGAPSDLDFVLS